MCTVVSAAQFCGTGRVPGPAEFLIDISHNSWDGARVEFLALKKGIDDRIRFFEQLDA
jgi:hypothetical protein